MGTIIGYNEYQATKQVPFNLSNQIKQILIRPFFNMYSNKLYMEVINLVQLSQLLF